MIPAGVYAPESAAGGRPNWPPSAAPTLDNRSLLNFEVMLVTVDRPFASSVEHMLSADFAQAQRMTLDDARVGFIQRLWMRLTRLFAPIPPASVVGITCSTGMLLYISP